MNARHVTSPIAARDQAQAPPLPIGQIASGVRALGIICAASGALGVALGALTLAWSPAVDDDVWSYPFPFGVGLVVGFVLSVVHLMSLGGFVAVRSLVPTRAGRLGAYAAMTGLAALAVSEAVGGIIGRARTDSTAAGVVNAMFAVASLLVAAGSVAAGLGVIRRRQPRASSVDPRRRAPVGAMVLTSGVTLFAIVIPANISGDLALRMGSLMAWSALYIGIGGLLARIADPKLNPGQGDPR